MKCSTVELILKQRLVAIIRLDDLSQAVPLSRALLAGGVSVQEFTLTNRDALEAIVRVRNEISSFRDGEARVGLGSVRNLDEARQAVDAGADFVVTPTTRIEVIEYCRSQEIPVLPGAMTPTEIANAWEAGASVVKVFPARGLGPDYIKDVLAPMPFLKLMPTGGIDLTNISQYLKSGAVALGVGGQLVNPRTIADGDWDAVTSLATQYAMTAHGVVL